MVLYHQLVYLFLLISIYFDKVIENEFYRQSTVHCIRIDLTLSAKNCHLLSRRIFQLAILLRHHLYLIFDIQMMNIEKPMLALKKIFQKEKITHLNQNF